MNEQFLKNFKEIERLSVQGNEYVDQQEPLKGLQCFVEALELLPDPKEQWEAGTWLYTALGDTFFQLGRYDEAIENLSFALLCPEGSENPFILLRLGQSLYEMEDFEQAREFLLTSYRLEGYDIFAGEDQKYFDFIQLGL